MRRRHVLAFCLNALLISSLSFPVAAQAPPPKLVLTIVVDQFRFDYLTRFGPEMTGGLKRLWAEGAVFTNANYESWPTVTAIGHSQIMSGATPSTSGIVGNEWWDRNEKRRVQSITDDSVALLGGAGRGASPRRLMTSTVGDELKVSGKGGKVIGISLKDRSAILPVGHLADAAYWFDATNGAFVSSTFYMPQLPLWVEHYNQARPADPYAGRKWQAQTMPAQPGASLYNAIDNSPFGDELVLDFARKVLSEEHVGQGPKTDLLSVSFSSVDYVGHRSGPDSAEMHAMILAVDTVIGRLLEAAERQVGAERLLVVFTADHGVAPVPEENRQRKQPGGRIDTRAERAAVEQALKEQFGDGQFLSSISDSAVYFNPDPLPGKKFDMAAIERATAQTLREQPHVYRVYTRDALQNGAAVGDRVDQRVRNGFNAEVSPDVMIVHEPYWLAGATGSNHGTPFSYDTHVPVVFIGPPALIRPGHYHRDVAVADIAPTLATLLGIATPSGSLGHTLDEVFR